MAPCAFGAKRFYAVTIADPLDRFEARERDLAASRPRLDAVSDLAVAKKLARFEGLLRALNLQEDGDDAQVGHGRENNASVRVRQAVVPAARIELARRLRSTGF